MIQESGSVAMAPKSLQADKVNWPLLLLAVLVAGWALYPADVLYHISDEQSLWQQPSELDQKFPDPISSRKWSFNFEEVETQLATVVADSNGHLVITERTPEILEKILVSLDTKVAAHEQERVVMLIRKSVGGDAGRKLAELIFQYSQYQEEYRLAEESMQAGTDSMLENASSTFKDETWHQKTTDMQSWIFGPTTAQAMFGRKHVLAEYLFQRRRVQSDPAMSEAEKNRRLEQLRQQYDDRIKPAAKAAAQ